MNQVKRWEDRTDDDSKAQKYLRLVVHPAGNGRVCLALVGYDGEPEPGGYILGFREGVLQIYGGLDYEHDEFLALEGAEQHISFEVLE